MHQPNLSLEVMNGPLDGQIITLQEDSDWSRAGNGALSFPWDAELGAPQARITFADVAWWLEPCASSRSTRHNGEVVTAKVTLAQGDWFKAANTWLCVRQVEAGRVE